MAYSHIGVDIPYQLGYNTIRKKHGNMFFRLNIKLLFFYRQQVLH